MWTCRYTATTITTTMQAPLHNASVDQEKSLSAYRPRTGRDVQKACLPGVNRTVSGHINVTRVSSSARASSTGCSLTVRVPLKQCPPDCETSFRVRRITCQYRKKAVEDKVCDPLIRPDGKRPCVNKRCNVYVWRTWKWDNVSLFFSFYCFVCSTRTHFPPQPPVQTVRRIV